MRKIFLLLLAGSMLPGGARPAHAQGYGRSVAVSGGTVFVADPGNVAGPGRVYAYRADSGRWVEVSRVTGPNAAAGDGFGAAIAAGGDLLLASRPGDEESRGVVYVFERASSGGGWSQVARLSAADGAPGDSLGTAIALDRNRALVAAMGAAGKAGAVYVFSRAADGRWTQEAKLAASDGRPGDGFGAAVALRGDEAVVGAPAQAQGRGGAYVFRRDPSGEWRAAGTMVARTVGEGDALGASVAFYGDRVAVGAPQRDENAGAVYLFSRDEESGGWAAYTRLHAFDGSSQGRFGYTLAVAGDELWIGAPGADGALGAIHRLRHDRERGVFTTATKLGSAELRGGAFFAAAVAVDGPLAVGAALGDDFGAGTAVVLGRDNAGEWSARGKIFSEAESFAAVKGGQVDCRGGKAAAFACDGVDLVSFLPVKEIGGRRGIRLNDVWGWTDPQTGREYALVGRMDGTAFVDITDAADPVYVGELPMTEGAQANAWRDIKVYNDHAFIVADGAGEHGMQVFDLKQLRNVRNAPVSFEATAHYDRIHSAHNIVINEATGFAFSVGSSGGGETCGGGLHMIDIRDPKDPRFAGCFADAQTGRASTGYSHDAQCVVYTGPDRDHAGREICFGANETALSISDVTDKSQSVAIARASYPNVGYTHQGWLTADQRYFYMNDELDELAGSVTNTRTLIWDVEDLDDPQLVGEYLGTTRSTDHNLYVKDDVMYQSNYVSGLRVIDIRDRTNPREIGFFDTVPYGENVPGFGGSWSNYPYFKSGNIVVTSGREGVFILKKREPVT